MPDARETLRGFALGFPGAWEDHPWGEVVAKVGRKVFVFLGSSEHPGVTVKLPESREHALTLPGAEPTGYGLGRSGWVTIPLRGRQPLGTLKDFIEESYRAVAPKSLLADLERRARV